MLQTQSISVSNVRDIEQTGRTQDPLIYGKSEVREIVGIEVNDDYAELFIQGEGNKVNSRFVPNKYWILSHRPLNTKFVRMKGDLYYKWGVQFKSRDEFLYHKNKWSKEDTYSIFNDKEAIMLKDGYTFYKGMEPKDVSILSFDIEATTIERNDRAKVLIISSVFRSKNGIERKLFCYDEYSTQTEFIAAWCSWVREMNPSIICGHNVNSYDLPYLIHCSQAPLCLGRDGSNIEMYKKESKFRVDGSRDLHYFKLKIHGRDIVDTMFLAYRYDIVAKKYETYGLKNIIKQEGLEKEGRQFYDAAQIRHNYQKPEEWAKIKEYCKDDADDALTLFDLMCPPFFYLAQSVPKSFQSIVESASGSQLNAVMVRSYLQEGHSIPKASAGREFAGAISMGNPGIYKNVFKIDVASLYPSIMLQYEVYDEYKDPKGNFLKILQYFTTERLKHKRLYKETKNKYHDDLQNCFKIFINSGYGFFGASGLNFNSPDCAELVTKKGREILDFTIQWATGQKYIENS